MYPLVTSYIFEVRAKTKRIYAASASSMVLMLLAAAFWGCATEALPEPILQRVCTAESTDSCTDWLYAGQSIQIRIEGKNLLQAWQVDLGKNDPPESLGSFRAWIGPAELSNVRKIGYLSSHGWEILEGMAPGTLDIGYYPVRIETPSGTTASFSGPIFVRTPLFVSLNAQKLHAPVQDTLRVVATVENKSMAALGDVSITVDQGGTGSVYLPDAPPVFSLDAQASLEVAMDLVGASPGQPQVQVRAQAVTGHGMEVETSVPEIVTLDILEAAVLQVEATTGTEQLAIGDELTLVMTAKNTGGVAVQNATMAIQYMEGQGQLQFSASGVSRRIDPDSEAVFTMKATALGIGRVYIHPLITSTEAISGRLVEASPSVAVQVKIVQE